MSHIFDEKSLERFRSMPPREAYQEAKDAVYRLGAVSSEAFREVFEDLVEEGVLTWHQIEEYER